MVSVVSNRPKLIPKNKVSKKVMNIRFFDFGGSEGDLTPCF